MKNCAVVFPGQGAQAVGMGKDLAASDPSLKELFTRANEVLGYDLEHICMEGPIEELTQSNHAQPAIFVASVAALEALKMRGVSAFAMTAGLSSGEYAALYASGVLTFEDALKLLKARSTFMQEACELNKGGMLSVMGMDLEQLQELCAQSGSEIANLNSPQQTVLSGTEEAIAGAESQAKEMGAKRALKLNVAGAFHSSLMQPAADKFEEFIGGIPFEKPAIPVLSNVTAEPHGDPESIRQGMVKQIVSPVRWVESVQYMVQSGVEQVVECGPGNVLTGLIKRIDKSSQLFNIQGLNQAEETAAALKTV